jgi:hypothetical protein
MKTLIISPLFPPDTGAPAPYTKELASRLGQTASLLVYGHLPEAVPQVPVTAIDKRSNLPLRLFRFTRALFKHSHASCFLVNSAPSVELPFLIFSLFTHPHFILLESDPLLEKKTRHGWYGLIHTLLKKRAHKVLVVSPEAYTKAETLPFTPFDTELESKREAWWQAHLTELSS